MNNKSNENKFNFIIVIFLINWLSKTNKKYRGEYK